MFKKIIILHANVDTALLETIHVFRDIGIKRQISDFKYFHILPPKYMPEVSKDIELSSSCFNVFKVTTIWLILGLSFGEGFMHFNAICNEFTILSSLAPLRARPCQRLQLSIPL
jgi:hypothetical protein